MAWYGLVDSATGDLVSVGTEAMFPDGNINAYQGVYDRVDFGASAPDFAISLWNPTTRAFVPRPVPILISRLDDIQTWLQSDPDWLAVWNTLTTARKTQIRTGFRRVLAKVLDARQWRSEDETVEL
jgi:hypothetical protein